METLVYYDILDSSRTSTRQSDSDRDEAIRVGHAEITLSVFRGLVPVLSQTMA